MDHESDYSQSLQMLLWEYADRVENSKSVYNKELDDIFIETLDKYKEVIDDVETRLINTVRE